MGVSEIEEAIRHLSREELRRLEQWMEEFLAEQWDAQIADDLEAGRLNILLQSIDEEEAAGLSRPL